MGDQGHFGIEAPRLMRFLAILVGLGYLIVAISHFLMPAEQLHFASGLDAEFFKSLASESGMFKIHYWAMVLTALCATGIVMGLGSQLLAFQWVRILALAGYIVTAISFVTMQFRALRLAQTFADLQPVAQEAVVNGGIGNLDPTGLFAFGLVGLWITVLNILAYTHLAWNPAVAILGVVGGVLAICAFLGTVFQVSLLVNIAAGAGAGLIIPVWFFTVGWQIGRNRRGTNA